MVLITEAWHCVIIAASVNLLRNLSFNAIAFSIALVAL